MINKIKISRVTILSFLTALFMMVYAFMVENGGYLDLDAVNLFRALLSVRALLVWLICFVSFSANGLYKATRVAPATPSRRTDTKFKNCVTEEIKPLYADP